MRPRLPDGLAFRIARQADAAAIRDLLFSVLAEFNLEAEHDGVDADLDDLDRWYFRGGGTFEVLVRHADDRVVGSWGLHPCGGGTAQLRKMYLPPELRGQGLGVTMMTRVLDYARGAGFRRIELETAQVLTRAVALYRSFGLQPIDPEALAARCDAAYALDLADEPI